MRKNSKTFILRIPVPAGLPAELERSLKKNSFSEAFVMGLVQAYILAHARAAIASARAMLADDKEEILDLSTIIGLLVAAEKDLEVLA